MDVVFTIVSRNYAAQAAVLMRSLADAEPASRRVVVATDGPIPELEPLAEVIAAEALDAPLRDMSVYYTALELNTAVKPFAFAHFLRQTEGASVTYLDPDIRVFRPLTAVREALARAPLALTPHVVRPLSTPGTPTNEDLARSGRFNLGFMSARRTPETDGLIAWWAERCRFDCRVAPDKGIFTDQKWMDQAPEHVPGLAILTQPSLNLAYWNLEGRVLEQTSDGWSVDGEPLAFFHFSGFDPARPDRLSKHQTRFTVAPGAPLARLLAQYAGELKAAGHAEASLRGYAFDRFASGRRVTPLMRRAALSAAREGQSFPGGLDAAAEAWMDAPDPSRPGCTRLMAEAARTAPAAAFPWWFAPNAEAFGADARSAQAALALRGAATEPAQFHTGDELVAWWLGPEAVAGRFDVDGLPDHELERIAAFPAILERAAVLADVRPQAPPLARRLFADVALPHLARWPAPLAVPRRAPHLAPADGLPAPYVRLFHEIWAVRPDLQQLFPLNRAVGRFRFLRWLIAGGLAEYGVPFEALPERVRRHPLMRLARATLRR